MRFEADEDARVMVLTGAGGIAFCAGADLKAIEHVRRAADGAGGPDGLHAPDPLQADDRRDLRLRLAGGLELALWCDLRIATEGSQLGYPERRWGVPLIDGGTQRLPRIVGLGPRARPDPHRTHHRRPGGARDGPAAPRWSPRARHLERALELAEGLARFPQRTMLADRRAAIEGFGHDPGRGARAGGAGGPGGVRGRASSGAARFAAGEGRGGAGAGA